MSFLDKAKDKIGKSFGDETVRVVNYDRDEDDTPSTPKEPKAPKVPREPRVKTPREPRPKRPPREKKIREPREAKIKVVKIKPVVEEDVTEKESFWSRKMKDDSAFEIEEVTPEDVVPEKAVEKPEKTSRRSREKKSEPEESDKETIGEILEFLRIPATFEIEKNIFLPEDIADVEFDLQAPYGFEQGQVTAFVDRTKVTVLRYVDLLKARNEHIAKLATTVDRLQVDNNNLKFQNELNSGINVIPTIEDSEDLETKLLESKLHIRRLEDTLRERESGDSLTSHERSKFEELQNQLSIVSREKQALEDEVYELKNQLAYFEENSDEDNEPKIYKENDSAFLPEISESLVPEKISAAPKSSSLFYTDDDEEDETKDELQQSPYIEVIGGDSKSRFTEEDDEDDDLDAIMRDWNHK